MNGAGIAFAPLKIMAGGEELQTIETKNIMKVLIIEDKDSVKKGIEEKFKGLGCSVDAVANPKEATILIEDNKYQLVIVDIRFDHPNISGDEFVRKNFDVLSSGEIVAFTGYRDDIDHNNEKLFSEIIDKGGFGNPLYEFAEKVYEERKQIVAEEIKNHLLKTHINENEAEMLYAKNKLIKTLNETENKNEKTVWYKGRDLSAKELIDEVSDEESDIGKSYIRMMLNWLKRKGEIK